AAALTARPSPSARNERGPGNPPGPFCFTTRPPTRNPVSRRNRVSFPALARGRSLLPLLLGGPRRRLLPRGRGRLLGGRDARLPCRRPRGRRHLLRGGLLLRRRRAAHPGGGRRFLLRHRGRGRRAGRLPHDRRRGRFLLRRRGRCYLLLRRGR